MGAPGRRGMGELEAQVMTALWELGAPATPREVLERLPAEPPVGYSAVMTVMRRLWKKGMLAREREGKAFTYRPVQAREQLTAERMVALLESSADPAAALAQFVGGLPEQRRGDLRRILRRRRT